MRLVFILLGVFLMTACGNSSGPERTSPDTVMVEVVLQSLTTNPSDPAYYWCTVEWTAKAIPRDVSVPYYAIVRAHTPTGDNIHPLGTGNFTDSVRLGLSIQSDARYPYPWTIEWNFFRDGRGYTVWGITQIEGGCIEGTTTLGDT